MKDIASKKANELLFKHKMEWRVCTPALLQEIFNNNPLGGIFYQPINIFRVILTQVTERCSELNDPVLNALMCRLALYGEADPYDTENYNPKKLHEALNHPDYLAYRKKRIEKTLKQKN